MGAQSYFLYFFCQFLFQHKGLELVFLQLLKRWNCAFGRRKLIIESYIFMIQVVCLTHPVPNTLDLQHW